MPKYSILTIALSILYLSGCNPTARKEGAEQVSLRNVEVVSNNFGSCDTVKNQGVSISVTLWQPSDTGEAAQTIREILARKSVDRINSYADSASIAANPGAQRSIKDAFEVFEKNYKDFKKDFPDAPGCWEVGLTGDTLLVSPKWMFYQLDHYSFTGGAHPNSFRSYHAFDGKTGAEVQMKTFIADSVALLKLVEKKFRDVEKLSATANLEDSGYFLLNHKFFVPANYVFTKDGILFYYNPYEIAAYVKGAIQFTIPYAELSGIVKKEDIF